jgi:nitroreductase
VAQVRPDRRADTSVPINPVIAARWSPRAFDASAELTSEQILAVLEAARWAATWGDRQPVRFIVGLRGDDTFAAIGELLKRGNSYAQAAGALILVCADEGPDDKTRMYAGVDTGAAIAQLTIEAFSRGLVAHPMAGFNAEAAREVFGLPEGARPFAVVAVGTLGDYATVDPAVIERDARGRQRLPLDQIAFTQRWGTPFRP